MSEKLRQELAAAARRMGFTDEIVGRLKPLLQVAFDAGVKEGQALPRPMKPKEPKG